MTLHSISGNSRSRNPLYENAIDQVIWGYKWGYIYILDFIFSILSMSKGLDVADYLSAIKPKFFQSSVGRNLNELKAVK